MYSKESIYDLIHEDHTRISALLVEVENAEDPVKSLLKLREEVSMHCAAIEDVIIPKLRKVMKNEKVGQRACERQTELNALVEKLSSLSVADELWNREFFQLSQRIQEHVSQEERRLFKKMKSIFGKKDLTALYLEYVSFKNKVIEQAA